jgi:hypothetical protein
MGNFRGQGVGVGCVMAALVVGAGAPASAEPLVCLVPNGTLPTVAMPQFGRLGGSVAVDGEWAVVGAPDDSTVAFNSGSFTIYRNQGGVWGDVQTFRLGAGSQFVGLGSSVALDATSGLMIVTIPGIFSQTGLVWTLGLAGETWQQISSPVPAEFTAGAEFGSSVALEGTYAVVGQRLLGTGRAYLFRFNGTTWDRLGTMQLPEGSIASEFGASVAMSGTTIVVGSPAGTANFGGLHVFEIVNDAPTFVTSLQVPDVGTLLDTGRRIAVSGDWIAAQSMQGLNGAGRVSMFRRSGGVWSFAQRLENASTPDDEFDGFGSGLALDGDRLVIGMGGNESADGAKGTVFVYGLANAQWSEIASVLRPFANRGFGSAAALSANEVLVGAPLEVVDNQTRGAVYSFDLNSASVGQQPTDALVSPGTSAMLSVALNPGAGSPVTYRWRRAGAELVDGGRVTGSTTATLTILNAQPGDLGAYDCVVTTPCGTLTSAPAAIAVAAPSSCNGDSNNDGSVTFVDITTVLANFGASCP